VSRCADKWGHKCPKLENSFQCMLCFGGLSEGTPTVHENNFHVQTVKSMVVHSGTVWVHTGLSTRT
jgi:hypothetical protein